MNQPAPVRHTYTQQAIPLKDFRNLRQVLRDLSNVRERVVVNLVEPTNRTLALSAETLRAALAGGPDSLVVQSLPRDVYRRVMCGKVERVAVEAAGLRGELRHRFVNDLAVELAGFLQHLDQLLFLLHGYALQDWRPRVTRLVQALTDLRTQLARSAAEHRDNVRCMDDLHYEIVPTLAALAQVFLSVD